MENAKIAILLATRNGGRYLRQQLDSLFFQEVQGWRLLVSDDGSTDDTPDILNEYSQKYPGRITLVPHEEPTGSSKNNFMLLTRQAGEFDYILYCDQDDVWLPQKVGMTLRKMRETERGEAQVPCLVHSDLAVVDEAMRLKHASFFYSSMLRADRDALNYLLIQNIVTGCTMMINHALWELAARPLEGGDMRMHDGWFALIASAMGRIGFISLPTMLYRQHGGNVVGAKDVRSLRYIASFAERLRDNRASIRQCQEQAGALLATFGDRLTERQKAMLADFAELPGRGKWRRLSVVSRYHIWLYGRRRKLAEILLI